jgi:hypothetical protein
LRRGRPAWERELSALQVRFRPVRRRRERQECGGAFLAGLLSGIERKICWLRAEQADAERP